MIYPGTHPNMFNRFLRYFLVILLFRIAGDAAAQEQPYGVPKRYNELNGSYSQDTATIIRLIERSYRASFTDIDSAFLLYKEAFYLSKQIDFKGVYSILSLYIGNYYRDKSDLKKSLSYYLQALSYIPYLQKGNRRSEFKGSIYIDIASIYFLMGQYNESALYYYKLLSDPTCTLGPNLLSRREITSALTGLGNVWTRLKKDELALQYYNRAEDIALSYKDTAAALIVWSSKSGAYAERKEWDSAEYSAIKVLNVSNGKLFRENTWSAQAYSMARSNAINNMIILMVNKDSFAAAIRYAQLTLDHNKQQKNEDVQGKMHTLSIIGTAYYGMGQYEFAEKKLLESLVFAEKSSFFENIEHTYYILSNIYLHKKNYERAFHYQRLYSKFNDSIRGPQTQQMLSSLEIKNRVVERDRELIDKKLQLAQQNIKIKQQNTWIMIVCAGTILFGVIGFGRYRYVHSLQEKRINILRQEQEIIQLKAMMEGEEKERMRIARDLHDGVSQTISAAKINLIAMEHEIAVHDKVQKDKLGKIIHLIDNSFKEVRTISHNMMPYALREAGLGLLIKQLVENISDDALVFNVYSNGMDEHFDSNIETVLYRVIQECVNNVLRHAQATRIDISLTKDEDGIRITIEDNGVGFDIKEDNKRSGIGMKNIRARIHYLSGQVEYDSSPGNGTLVSIHVPV